MAEATFAELTMNLINWIESLYEKYLKIQAQNETLTKDLKESQNLVKQLKAELMVLQNNSNNATTLTAVPVTNIGTPISPNMLPSQHQQPTIYQPIASTQSFAPQPSPYVWTYDQSGHEMQIPYYEPYGPQAFHQP